MTGDDTKIQRRVTEALKAVAREPASTEAQKLFFTCLQQRLIHLGAARPAERPEADDRLGGQTQQDAEIAAAGLDDAK